MSVSKERKNLLVLVDEALFSFNKAWFDISTEEFSREEIMDLYNLILETGNFKKTIRTKSKKKAYYMKVGRKDA
ncbi:hypothetical protein KKH13_04730 [Patescibacteria group bacterium]|uniref:Uncharacterized protein n=1 Tax=viral metagenome TaxID=1070528 RepID=A0A6M3IT16_9ZZZZ|nr:hypothetical protein [Patescibacteria group bacterium]